MVAASLDIVSAVWLVSVLALSSRFDGRARNCLLAWRDPVSVLALSSRFDGLNTRHPKSAQRPCFSTRSVESF